MIDEGTDKTYEALYRLLSAWLNDGAAAVSPPDWEALFLIAERHSLGAAVCMALEKTGLAGQCPPQTVRRFREAKGLSLYKTLLMDAERERLLAFMEENGIWYMLLKGIVLKQFYPGNGAREFADNDILFDASRWEMVRDYMKREGYKVVWIDNKAQDIYQKLPVYVFEMHRMLFTDDGRSSFQKAGAAYYADMRSRMLKDRGNDFGYHLSDEDFYIYLIAHAFKHYADGGTGLRTLLDVYLYRKNVRLNESYIAAELSKLGISDFEARCRTLADRLFGPALFKEELTEEEKSMLAQFEGAGTFGNLSQQVQSRLIEFQKGGGLVSGWTRVRFLLRQVFPEMEWYRSHAPFAYRHRWAVPFVWARWTFFRIFTDWKHTSEVLKEIFRRPDGQSFLLWAVKGVKRRILAPFQEPVSRMPVEKCAALAMQTYESLEGHTFDLRHPMLFTEKQVWYKLFYEHPDMPRILDKYLLKNYVKEKAGPGYTAPLYGVWTDMRRFRRDWESLPDELCLKSNCSYAGYNLRLIHDRRGMDSRALFREVRRWLDPMKTCLNTSLRAYRNVVPCIMAERLLPGEEGQLNDYKIYCFDGKPEFVGVVSDRFSSEKGGAFGYYDLSWSQLPVTKRNHPKAAVPRPRCFDEMLRLSVLLSEGFPFMRVDLYESEGRVYVGELTPFSGNHFDQRQFDLEIGKKFVLPGGGE